jgi:hypothetical protein
MWQVLRLLMLSRAASTMHTGMEKQGFSKNGSQKDEDTKNEGDMK